MAKKREPQSLNRIINTFYIFFLALIIVFSILFSSLTTSREVANTTYANVENSLKDKHGSLDRTFNQL
jgi:two-component system sensor histidine kinase YesM